MGMSIEDIEQWARQNNYTIVSDNWWEAAQDRINKYQKICEIMATRDIKPYFVIIDEIIRVIDERGKNEN